MIKPHLNSNKNSVCLLNNVNGWASSDNSYSARPSPFHAQRPASTPSLDFTVSSRQSPPEVHRSVGFSTALRIPICKSIASHAPATSHPHQRQQHQQLSRNLKQPDLFIWFLESEPLDRPHEIPMDRPCIPRVLGSMTPVRYPTRFSPIVY